MEPWDVEGADPQQQVGARHHTVPAFYIRKFANRSNQVWVRDRRSAEASLRRDLDLAVRDFYTFTNLDGQSDGRLEQLLEKVETDAAPALGRLRSTLTWNTPMSEEDRVSIATFVAFQMIRGPRKRRQVEQQADLYTRLMELNPPDDVSRRARAEYQQRQKLWQEYEVVPDPGEHLRLLGPVAEALFDHLITRPIVALTLTDGALLSCDEPVLLVQPDSAPGPLLPDPPAFRSRSRRRKGVRTSRRRTQLIQIQNPGGGLLTAEAVLLPLGRRTMLGFGTPSTECSANVKLSAEESRELAAQANELTLSQAYFFAFCHPGDSDLLASPLPEVQPLVRIGGAYDEHKRVAASAPERLQTEVHGRRRPKPM